MEHVKDIENHYMTVEEASKKWGVSTRRIQILCAGGKLDGTMQIGRTWFIPKNLKKPPDGRTKKGQEKANSDMPLPRKTPFLYMTDLYRVPGSADTVAESLAYNPEARILFEAEVAYSRGEIDNVYESATYLLEKHSGFYAVISAGMLLAFCAIWKGDIEMWHRAKVHISEAKARVDHEHDMIELAICAVDSMLYDVKNFPDWFKIGCFEPLHKDSLPAAKVYYAKYLYAIGHGLATKTYELKGVSGLALLALLPATVEPMISWAKADETVVSETYLRLTCAVIYHLCGNDDQATRQIDRAIELALPDRLYGLLAEYCRTLGTLLENRIKRVSEDAWSEVSRLFKLYSDGWTNLNNKITGRKIVEGLTKKNREVMRLAAIGYSDAEIAEKTNMSISGVKQTIKVIKQKSNLEDRKEFAAIL
jgi:DNA-binding CsgD family transcriptional regulator